MSFRRLLDNDLGRIVLLNLRETIRADILDTHVEVGPLLGKLRDALARLVPGYGPDALNDAIGGIVWSDPSTYQFAARETPSISLRIAAVRPYDEIKLLLEKIRTVHRLPALASALAPDPTDEALSTAADLITEYSQDMPKLAMGRTYDFFWASIADEVAAIEKTTADKPAAIRRHMTPRLLRDRLGLVHLRPSRAGKPIPLFVFEAKASLTELGHPKAFRVSRPTTLDGFDNPRFRQQATTRTEQDGCGATVDLSEGLYGDGLPEMVSREIALLGRFECRYVGRLATDAVGSDKDFVSFLARHIKPEELDARLGDLAAELDAKAA